MCKVQDIVYTNIRVKKSIPKKCMVYCADLQYTSHKTYVLQDEGAADQVHDIGYVPWLNRGTAGTLRNT